MIILQLHQQCNDNRCNNSRYTNIPNHHYLGWLRLTTEAKKTIGQVAVVVSDIMLLLKQE